MISIDGVPVEGVSSFSLTLDLQPDPETKRIADGLLYHSGCWKCGVIKMHGDPYVCEHGVTIAPQIEVTFTTEIA